MGRPKQNPDSFIELELRITPPSQEPITDWKLADIEHLVVFEEGSANGTPKLHYHGYIKTLRSKSWIRNWIYDITNAKQFNIDGNSVYFSKQPHDHTFGYIAKLGKCVLRHGLPQTTIDEWLAQSNDYRKQRAKLQKNQSRSRSTLLEDVISKVENDLKEGLCTKDVDSIVWRFLEYCKETETRFPTRSQMDNYVLKLLYPYNPYVVRSYYNKSFDYLKV